MCKYEINCISLWAVLGIINIENYLESRSLIYMVIAEDYLVDVASSTSTAIVVLSAIMQSPRSQIASNLCTMRIKRPV